MLAEALAAARRLVPEDVLINGCRIACGAHGHGEPALLLHGTPSSSYIWRNVTPALTAAGYRVYLYDLPGYGLSERPHSDAIDTSVSGQVPMLQALLAHWGLERFHLVAHDIGGAVAQRLALAEPLRIKTLTLIDTVSYDSWPSKRTHQQMREGLETLIKKPDALHRRHFTEWLYSTVENKEQLRADALELYLHYISGAVGQGSFFQHQVSHYDPKHTAEISDRLPALGAVPVQLIWGEQDGWQVTDWAHKLHAAIPGSALHILGGCGHFVMEDNPAEVSRLLTAFMQTADGGDDGG